MKIQIFSDIHIEFRGDKPFQIPEADSDLVVLAGDIGVGVEGIEWAAGQSQRLGKQILYVPGNHEYYDNEITRHEGAMRERAEALGVVFLNEQVFDYQGYRFIGATLWTSFTDEDGAEDQFAIFQAKRAMADFHVIRMREQRLRPSHTQILHASAAHFIEQALSSISPGRAVVITHHAPSHRCGNPDFPFGPMSRAFSSNLDHLLGKSALWIYGHTHACFDQTLDGTRVVTNQLGYPYERNHGFDPNKVIEI